MKLGLFILLIKMIIKNFIIFNMDLKTIEIRLVDCFLFINEALIGLISIDLQNEISNDFILTAIINLNFLEFIKFFN